jgi:tetratricopeptide (TPR) repeat protein
MRARFLLLFLVGALLGAAPVLAQSTRPDAASEAEYQTALKNALDEFNAGNWEEARALFERAHALQPSARTLRGLGITAFEERHYVDALSYLRAALADRRKPLTAAQRTEVTALSQRAEGNIVRLSLELSPADAQVRIDGRPATLDAERTLLLDPGRYEIVVSAAAPLRATAGRARAAAIATAGCGSSARRPRSCADRVLQAERQRGGPLLGVVRARFGMGYARAVRWCEHGSR